MLQCHIARIICSHIQTVFDGYYESVYVTLGLTSTMKCVKIYFWCKFAIYCRCLYIGNPGEFFGLCENLFCDGEQLSIYCLVRCRKPCCVARDASLQLKGCRLKMPNEWTRTAKCHRLKVFPSFFIFHLAPFQLFSITSVESTGQQSGSDSASN